MPFNDNLKWLEVFKYKKDYINDLTEFEEIPLSIASSHLIPKIIKVKTGWVVSLRHSAGLITLDGVYKAFKISTQILDYYSLVAANDKRVLFKSSDWLLMYDLETNLFKIYQDFVYGCNYNFLTADDQLFTVVLDGTSIFVYKGRDNPDRILSVSGWYSNVRFWYPYMVLINNHNFSIFNVETQLEVFSIQADFVFIYMDWIFYTITSSIETKLIRQNINSEMFYSNTLMNYVIYYIGCAKFRSYPQGIFKISDNFFITSESGIIELSYFPKHIIEISFHEQYNLALAIIEDNGLYELKLYKLF